MNHNNNLNNSNNQEVVINSAINSTKSAINNSINQLNNTIEEIQVNSSKSAINSTKNDNKLNRSFYILQSGLNKYFQRLEQNNEVTITDRILEANLFTDECIANRFKIILKNSYNNEFHVIKI